MQLSLVFSLGYLVSDLLTSYMVFGPKNFMETAIHHGAGFIAIPTALYLGKHLGTMNECFLFTELSTVFLNFMWILKLTGNEEKHSKLKMVNSLMLVLSFVGSRMLFLGTVFLFYYMPNLLKYNWNKLAEEMGTFKVVLMCSQILLIFTIMILNFYWGSKII